MGWPSSSTLQPSSNVEGEVDTGLFPLGHLGIRGPKPDRRLHHQRLLERDDPLEDHGEHPAGRHIHLVNRVELLGIQDEMKRKLGSECYFTIALARKAR